jgi:hypothetical protein
MQRAVGAISAAALAAILVAPVGIWGNWCSYRQRSAACAVQIPDATKRQRADFLIETDKDLSVTREEVAELVHQITLSQRAAAHNRPPAE